MKTAGSNDAYNSLAANSASEIGSEAQLQGLDSRVIVCDCVSCYGNTTVTENASTFEGEYQYLSFLPFEEAKSNKVLAAFLLDMRRVGGTLTSSPSTGGRPRSPSPTRSTPRSRRTESTG